MQAKVLRVFHQRLQEWYALHGRRDLPWRQTDDPYAIYLSEIMLQQTQVKTVLERFYFPFLQKFPTLASLASTSEEEVLTVWQGLGYYTRARNLHQSARRCGNGLPDDVEALMALPGIGRNTAHAIAAFAYRQPVAVMEANVRRVVSRIFALPDPSEAVLWEKAALLLDPYHPFDYNQAMMDIGAMVCKKTTPLCPQCPAQSICKGKGNPQNYPAAKQSKTPPVRRQRIVVLQNTSGEYYATPRATRFLKGLYHFIELEEQAKVITHAGYEYVLSKARSLGEFRQVYSHFTLDAQVYLVRVAHASGKYWYHREALEALPLSMAERKILALL